MGVPGQCHSVAWVVGAAVAEPVNMRSVNDAAGALECGPAWRDRFSSGQLAGRAPSFGSRRQERIATMLAERILNFLKSGRSHCGEYD